MLITITEFLEFKLRFNVMLQLCLIYQKIYRYLIAKTTVLIFDLIFQISRCKSALA